MRTLRLCEKRIFHAEDAKGAKKKMEKTAGLSVHYDKEVDVLYLAREGKEASTEEVYPGIILEFDEEGNIISIEILNASLILKDTIESIREKIA